MRDLDLENESEKSETEGYRRGLHVPFEVRVESGDGVERRVMEVVRNYRNVTRQLSFNPPPHYLS